MPTDQTTNNLTIVITELSSKIEVLLEKQEEMAENIAKIKDAVYHPDRGLYARLRELENWKKTHSRIQWLIISSIVALTTGAIWNLLIPS